jgi:hypothetical protein
MRLAARFALSGLLLSFSAAGVGQAPAPLANPNLQLVTNGTAYAVARLPGGDIVIGGTFVSVNGTPRSNIAKVHADGTIDTAWDPASDGAVYSLAADAAGNVYVGGAFAAIGGQSRPFIAKLSGIGSGAADPAWNPSPNGPVFTIATDSTRVYAGGAFTSIGGQLRQFVARLSSSGAGAADANWDPSADGGVSAIAVDGAGNAYVAGNFLTIGGQARQYLAKLLGDGLGEADALWAPSPDNIVNALAVDHSGNVYAGGNFATIGGQTRNFIAKLAGNGTGAADAIWNPSADNEVYALALDVSGHVFAAGAFAMIGGQAHNFVARLSGKDAGAADASWSPAVDGVVLALDLHAGNQIYAGGNFANVGGQSRWGFAMLNNAGSVIGTELDIESPGAVYAIARQAGGAMVFGGVFGKANGERCGNLLRLRTDGTIDAVWNPSADGWVNTLAVDAQDNVYAGGGFTRIGGQSRSYVAKLSGATGAVDATWDPSADSYVYVIALDSAGSVYAAGNFTIIGGRGRNYIAKLSSGGSGAADASWDPSANSWIDALAIDATGNVYAGGSFTFVGGQNRNYIAKLSGGGSGAADAGWDPSADNWVEVLAVDAGGSVYAGGYFGQIGGQFRRGIAALSGSGSGAADPNWNPNAASFNFPVVYALAIDAGGNVYAGGDFNLIGGHNRNRIAMLSGSGAGTADVTWDPSPDQPVTALALNAAGQVVVGGVFVSIGGAPRLGLAEMPAGELLFANAFEDRFFVAPIVTCSTNAECTNGNVCAAGTCQAIGSIGVGGQCSATRDCSLGLYCSEAGVCTPAGSGSLGGACGSGANCSADLTCKLYGFGGTCSAAGSLDLGEACATTSDCIAGLACGAGKTCVRAVDAYPPFGGVACAADENPFRVFFEVPRPGVYPYDFFRLPFPNDIRINADGTLDLTDFPRPGPSFVGFDLVDRYATALSVDFSGFSAVQGVTFRFSRELDFDTLGPNGQGVHFVDITSPAEPGFGSDRGRNFGYDTGAHPYVCQNSLVVAPSPSDPLRPGGTYAVYLTSAIRSMTGDPPVQDPDLAALLASVAPADPALALAWTRYANFRAYLTANVIAPDQVAAVSVLTVGNTTATMLAMKDAVEAQPVPVLSDLTVCGPGVASPCALPGDSERVCGDSAGTYWEIHGRMSIPNFQQGSLPYELPADGGQIDFDSGGAPIQAGALNVCFALTIPKSAEPASGWPLLVHAHAAGGSFRSAIENGIAGDVANAAMPMATLTFEGVGHGERRGASFVPPDGLVFNLFNPPAAVGNHLQGAADVLQALRVADDAPFSLAPVGTIGFDPAHVYFFGDSQGANFGMPAIAVSDRAPAVVLSGAASYLTEDLLTRTSPTDAKAALQLLLGDDSVGTGNPVIALMQTYFDAIDPVNYAPLVLKRPPAGLASKHVYLPWGLGDTYTPDPVMRITAGAMGLPLAAPVLEPVPGIAQIPRPVAANLIGGDGVARTGACFQYAPGVDYDGHFVSTSNPDAVVDWTDFLQSHVQTGTPVVP